jgi:hypothetical protein
MAAMVKKGKKPDDFLIKAQQLRVSRQMRVRRGPPS